MKKNEAIASILGTGRYIPDRILTNAELEKKVDTTDEWIRSRTGIRERRIAAPGQHASDMGVEACKQALKKSGLQASDVDAIICATISPDYPWPATACLIQEKLGAKKAFAFDVSAACSGFVYGLSVAQGLIATGQARYVLVIGAEKLSSIVNWEDRNTCVLFGDGASAALVGPAGERGRLYGATLGSDGSAVELLFQPGGGTVCPITPDSAAAGADPRFLFMDGKGVFKFATRVMGEASAQALQKAGLQADDIQLFIPHQANIRIIESAAKRIGIPMDRVYVNVDRFGNTSAASVGIALDEAVETGRFKEGDKAVLVAFGAGLTWAACVLEW
jgi:3-oxoacyl-[acyl-carrier-protein] synthase-3